MSHLQILGVGIVTCNNFHTVEPHIFGTIVKHLVVTANWRQRFGIPDMTDFFYQSLFYVARCI